METKTVTCELTPAACELILQWSRQAVTITPEQMPGYIGVVNEIRQAVAPKPEQPPKQETRTDGK